MVPSDDFSEYVVAMVGDGAYVFFGSQRRPFRLCRLPAFLLGGGI